MNKSNEKILSISEKDVQRFRRSYIVRGTGCWEWIGKPIGDGYGRMCIERRAVRAHRLSFFIANGVLPAVTDHLCRNRACVNPDHLESVDDYINSMRGESPLSHNAKKTHCAQGHEYSPENTIYRICKNKKYPRRVCRACLNALARKRWPAKSARRKAAMLILSVCLLFGMAMGQTGTATRPASDPNKLTCPSDDPRCPKPAKPPAKKVAWSALSQAKPVIKMCSGLTGECDPTALDGLNTFNACRDQKWIGMAKWKGKDVRCAELRDAVKASDLADMIPDTAPLDVPAIRKTQEMRDFPEHVIECGMAESLKLEGLMAQCLKRFEYWDCADRDAYSLQISVSGKNANCHRIAP